MELAASTAADAPAGDRYLLLADISGFTSFLASVEEAHGVDFSEGIPIAYSLLAELLDSVTTGLSPEFALVKLEGDAVFACAAAASLDGEGAGVLDRIATMYAGFLAARTRATPGPEHVCTACPNVAYLDLKVILHRGVCVRQSVGGGSDLLGPAVTVAHRLLKNGIRDRIGYRPYLFVTDAAATGLGVTGVGLAHQEQYPDAAEVRGSILDLRAPLAPLAPVA
ncbi:DUF2652 domain-containing protein [Agromyces aurantiacus]|uniref:DUF2652 domain-containing protein n=1 Tax=Agromyces aurantiacus TaxID=165814 RepID=A0ABV9R586_9MICO|nr:DUF2652 domain-containing protein [Agromyces aurantiacus]MBM7503450.1 class 3 adenylate cyclase [Agromyces aurantiacus]